jgi:hypothetical protein
MSFSSSIKKLFTVGLLGLALSAMSEPTLADVKSTVTYPVGSSYNLRIGTTIVSRHGSLDEAVTVCRS